MTQARTTEPVFNSKLGDALRQKHPLWGRHLGAEQTSVIDRAPGQQPDIIISVPNSSPVIIETEFMPAATVEQDARSRLNNPLASTRQNIENAIALRIPAEMKTIPQEEISPSIETVTFDYCIFSLTQDVTPERWPERGWLKGDLNNLATTIESVAISESLLATSTDELERGVTQAANFLKQVPAGTNKKIARKLCQEPGEQTSRMATAIIANAIIFHCRIEGKQGIPTLSELQTANGVLSRKELIKCWRWIITEINYWPIFKIASDLLSLIPIREAGSILKLLEDTSENLTEIGATGINDLSGRMFQTLISDRKFLATFYTLPVSATLLAELAISRLDIDWGDEDVVKSLRIGDFACGTGALLNAAYHSICARCRRAGGDDSKLHASMIESSLFAFDIMPAATHLTASTLSNAHPGVPFDQTRIVTMPYGYVEPEIPYIGSLELIADEHTIPMFSVGRQRVKGKGKAGKEDNSMISVPHQYMDVIIMNPPFTRPTNHESTDVPVPSFAGFQKTEDEQIAMSDRLEDIRRKHMKWYEPAGHGNAGLASNFMDLAHVKLKPGGILALVLPASFVQGASWNKARALLSKHYQEMVIVSLATTGKTERAFSADTGMAEVLVVARKRAVNHQSGRAGAHHEGNVQFANLRRRPVHHVAATEAAKSIEALRNRSAVGPIMLGDGYTNGSCISMDYFEGGCAGVVETGLAAFVISLSEGVLIHPRENDTAKLPITSLDSLGKRGLVDRDFIGPYPRGLFDKINLQTDTPTYPALWNHDAARERMFMVEPDCELIERDVEMEEETGEIEEAEQEKKSATQVFAESTSRLHINRDFQLNSQSLGACLTPEKSAGGRSWPNFLVTHVPVNKAPVIEKALLIWFNSTFGLMSYWWSGTRQQLGRSVVTISALPSLIALDTRELKQSHLDSMERIFEKFRERPFRPANEACEDENRIELDNDLLDILGMPASFKEGLDLIRKQWCNEPSVHGGKGGK